VNDLYNENDKPLYSTMEETEYAEEGSISHSLRLAESMR
jgi:hypothetical protein